MVKLGPVNPVSGEDCCEINFVIIQLVYFVFKLGETIIGVASRLFIYHGVCLQYAQNNEACRMMGKHSSFENNVQSKAASYVMYFKIFGTVPVMLVGLFCGAWSDRVGRKPPALLPPLGSILCIMCYMAGIVYQGSQLFLTLVLVGRLVHGTFGKAQVMAVVLNSCTTDITPAEIRTARFSKLLGVNFCAASLGSVLTGIMLEFVDFNVVFCVVAFIEAICVILIVFCMKETVPMCQFGAEISTQMKIPFSARNIIDSFNVLFRPRNGKERCHLLILYLTKKIHQMCNAGEVDILPLFAQGSILNWSGSMFGYLMSIRYACMAILLLFIIPIMSAQLGLHDMSIVLIGMTFKMLYLIMMTFSNSSWMVFVTVIIGSPSIMMGSAVKAQISKIVCADEIGKALSILLSGETLADILGTIIFINIYAATFHVFAGMAFLILFIFRLVLFLFILLVAWDIKSPQPPGSSHMS